VIFDDESDAAPSTPPESEDELQKDEDGCISIDLGEETNFADLLDEAAASMSRPAAAPEAAGDAPAPADAGDEPAVMRGSVNLLAEILAEEGEDILRSSATEQVSTIASEIGRNLGVSAELDPESQYQQGLVYLELGLHDQAVLAFTAAARSERFTLQAREMWGIALQRDGHAETALAVLQEGLAIAGTDDSRALGLHYHAGRILEDLGRLDEAQQHYRRVHSRDAGFADVVQRLRTPVL
jgi:tetratricopeptide (TPR) repeat protein